MVDGDYITLIIEDILYALLLLFNLIHSCFILFNHRFRHRNNLFILNICFSLIVHILFSVNYFNMQYFDPHRLFFLPTCNLLFYAYSIASVTTPLSFVNFTIHRFYSIVYHTKPFFKTKRWMVICITSQRIAELIISLPYVLTIHLTCVNPQWLNIYTCMTAVVVPLLINTVLNVLIFKYVRASTRRIHAQTTSTIMNSSINQQPRISRREISLLKQLIFMFCTFIGGWTPVYVILMIDISHDPMILRCLVIVFQTAMLAITINFFICNHEISQYLIDKIRQCVRRLYEN